MPNDLFESQTITTSGSIASLAHDSDATCVSVAKKYGLSRLPVNIGLTGVTLYSARQGQFSLPPSYYTTNNFTVGGYSIKDTSNNILSGWSILTSGQPADWTGITYKQCTVSGTMWIKATRDEGSYGTASKFPLPAYISEAGFKFLVSGYTEITSFGDDVEYYTKPFSFSGYATPGGAGSSTVYKPADYSFISPPTGLAEFLRSTQNWIPYEGSIELEQEDVGAVRYVGNKINIINSLPAFSTMGALVSGESLEIETGRTTINLGAPARNDYRTLVDKIRKTSQDNIVYV